MSPALLVVMAAVAMEPFAAIVHRAVMHRSGWGWHRSHHVSARHDRSGARAPERNDLYPVCFGGGTIAAMAFGAANEGARPLLWLGVGVTAYGLAYVVVHDVCIHGRLGRPHTAGPYLRWVRDAHRVHHSSGRAPYGFLLPVVPRDLRRVRSDEPATDATLRNVETRARPAKTS